MKIRKLILTIIILFSLNFTYTTQQFISKEKGLIVRIIQSDDNKTNFDLLEENERRKFEILVSLTIRIMLIENKTTFFNTS